MPKQQVFLTVKDHSVSGEEFKLVYNSTYDLLETTPKPSPEELPRYYQSEDYISHTDASNGIFNKAYQFVKRHMLNKKIALVKKYVSGGTLLDIGAGTGDFLATAKRENFKITGVEPNSKARLLALKKNVDLLTTKDTIEQPYDVITMWHVLEHLTNFMEEAKWLGNHVKTSGYLIIAVPNYKSYDAKKYKEHWAAYDVPRHVFHFSKKSIHKIFHQNGFDLVNVKPMWFDSFYVSILSEKYENNKLIFLRGFLTGAISNVSALFTKEASSHIYVLKKRN